MAESLPQVEHDFVVQCQEDYDKAFAAGKQSAIDDARLRLVWALVHSKDGRHVSRGRSLALASVGRSEAQGKDFRYLASVAAYKMRHYVDARREVNELLKDFPEFRQAEFLKGCIEDAMIREGLIGVGAVAAVAGVAGLIVMGMLGGKRK